MNATNLQRTVTAERPVALAPVGHDAASLTAVRRLRNRAAGLIVLAIVVGLLGMGARCAYYAITDAWIAPLYLSPHSDAVLPLKLKMAREQDEMARVQADLQRIDGNMKAVDAAIAKLGQLQDGERKPLTWQAHTSAADQQTLRKMVTALEAEVAVVERQHARQVELTAAAARDLKADLIDRDTYQKAEQARDALEVALAEKRRMLAQARHERKVAAAQTGAYRAVLAGRGPSAGAGTLPDVAASEEHASRMVIELMRLQAEKRSLTALRSASERGLARERDLLGELKSRPLFRAMTRSTDVGFVPYSQLDGVHVGAPVMACTWSLFFCHRVGEVSEILDGEVVTKDPWGDLARGQYVILHLDDQDAIQDKLLRIRP